VLTLIPLLMHVHSRSVPDNALALCRVAAHQSTGMSYDAAVKCVAHTDIVSPNTIRRAHTQLISTGALAPPSSSHRGSGNPNHPLHSPAEPSFDIEICIHRTISTATQCASHIAVKHIQQHLMEEESVFVPDWTFQFPARTGSYSSIRL